MSTLTPTAGSVRHRALCFLARDPLLNHGAARALLYEGATVAGMAESGEAVVGVAIAGLPVGGEPLYWLDAIGPIALRRLLATLRQPLRRVLAGHPWIAEALAAEIGPVRGRHTIEIHAGQVGQIGQADTRARLLNFEQLETLRARTSAWNLAVLSEHTARGGEVYGILQKEDLIAHVACGFPANGVEEITHLYVAPDWRGRGLARALTLAAMAAIEARGYRPLYRNRAGNRASRRVAVRCGLVRIASVQEVVVEAAARPRTAMPARVART